MWQSPTKIMSVQDVRGYFSYDFQQCLYEACSLVWVKIKKNLETNSCWIKTWFLLFGIIDFGRSGVNIRLWISSTRFPSLFCPFSIEKRTQFALTSFSFMFHASLIDRVPDFELPKRWLQEFHLCTPSKLLEWPFMMAAVCVHWNQCITSLKIFIQQ